MSIIRERKKTTAGNQNMTTPFERTPEGNARFNKKKRGGWLSELCALEGGRESEEGGRSEQMKRGKKKEDQTKDTRKSACEPIIYSRSPLFFTFSKGKEFSAFNKRIHRCRGQW